MDAEEEGLRLGGGSQLFLRIAAEKEKQTRRMGRKKKVRGGVRIKENSLKRERENSISMVMRL